MKNLQEIIGMATCRPNRTCTARRKQVVKDRTKGHGGKCVALRVFFLCVLALALCCSASYAADQNAGKKVNEKALVPAKPPAVPQQKAAPGEPAATQQESASPQTQPVPQSQEPSPSMQAIQVLRAEIAIDSLNPQLRYELANALEEAGDKSGALSEYDKALSLKPGFKEALVNRGAVFNEMGRVVDAIDSFEKALALSPRDTRAMVNLGNSLYALQRYGEALEKYKLSVAADSAFGEGYYYIGIAFADAGMYREAIREWEKILQVAPNSEAAKNARENLDTLKSYLTSDSQPGARPKME